MSRYLRLTSFALFLIFLIGCQKELSEEAGQISKGSLQSNLGDCMPMDVNGIFKAGQALVDSNYIEVTINVTQTGSYTVFTDTVNGYSFRGTGSFANNGANTIRLKGSGTPGVQGTDAFTVIYDSSFCVVPVSVLAGGSSSGGTGVYTLQGTGGSCSNATTAGTYTQSTALNTGNTMTVQVNVTTIGTWTVSTNTVAGMSFTGSGNFTTTGVQNITLNGAGTPTAAGPQTFTITAGTSTCTAVVTVLPNTTPPSVFTLAGSPGTCTSAAVNGTYTQGTALGTTNTVAVQVNVTTAGPWTVSTNTVAGMSFSGSGTFATTGVQNITLNGAGNPTTAGAQTFTVTAGTATCTFVVTVAPGTPPPAGDHFILTNNSWWSYNTPISASDTLKRTIVGSVTASGFTYKAMKELNTTAQISDSLYFRKSGNNYWEFNFVDFYTSFYFDNLVVDSINFLKEGLTTGQTWSSPEYSDSVNNVPTKVRYQFTCTDANATVTLNGKTFTGVYKVTLVVQVNENNTGYATDITWTNYYAQGIGWIYQKYDDGGFQYELPIRYYQVF